MSSVSNNNPAPREYYRDYCTDPKKAVQLLFEDKGFLSDHTFHTPALRCLRSDYDENPSKETLVKIISLIPYYIRDRDLEHDSLFDEHFINLKKCFPNCRNRETLIAFLIKENGSEVEVTTNTNVLLIPSDCYNGILSYLDREPLPSPTAEIESPTTGHRHIFNIKEITHIRVVDPDGFPRSLEERSSISSLVQEHLLPPLADITLSYERLPLELQDKVDLYARLPD